MISEVHAAYQALLKVDQTISTLPDLERVAVVVTRETVTPDALAAILNRHAQCPGWVRLQSALYRTPAGTTAEPKAGLALAAEWCLSDSESAHLRQDGKGGWVLYHYRDFSNLADAQNICGVRDKALECLRERTTALAADILPNAADPDQLAYYIYWGGDGVTIRRLFARFDGFHVRL